MVRPARLPTAIAADRPSRERWCSPRPFARGSMRVDKATPSPRRPITTKFSDRMLGGGYRSISSCLGSAGGTSCSNRAEKKLKSGRVYRQR